MRLSHRFSPILLALIVFVGALLRFYAIGEKTIWLDEAFSIWVANHSPLEIGSWLIRIDQHPPLYYLLLAAWQHIFGDLQGTVRFFSALCGVATLPLFYGAARQLTGDEITALMAATILALSPFHVRYAQEARMYALLTLAVAAAFYCLVRGLSQPIPSLGRRGLTIWWVGFAVAQAAVMLSHNTATVFFPLAVNLPILGVWFYQRWQRRPASLAALANPRFLRLWVQSQGLAILLWLPWSIPFVIQSIKVDEEFWLLLPTGMELWNALLTFNFAHLPTGFPLTPLWMGIYGGLALFGLYRLRHKPVWIFLLLSLFATAFVGELLVSLRRPIFYDRTLIWTTLPYYLLIAMGLRGLARFPLRWTMPTAALLMVAILSGYALFDYYVHFEKEEWATAAAYVAEQAQPEDLLLFNATWVQLPFDYYFRHYALDVDLRGAPVDLFERGVLEPKMTHEDLPYLHQLIQDRPRVWLIYSHEWYTDAGGLIPRYLDEQMRRVEERYFIGVQVIEFVDRGE
jgi:4-amino-4-deoxy-L-arabinose transferase-like glycosyltransferase